MVATPIKIRSLAGIKRDGTRFEGEYYVDGAWVRFQRGLPRKMWGYRATSNELTGITRGMHQYSANNLLYVHLGNSDYLDSIRVDNNGNSSVVYNRTPAGFAASANNMWQFDVLYDSITTAATLIAHAAPNLSDIASETNASIYSGAITGTGALTSPGGPSISGGIAVLHPFVVAFGSAGYFAWSAPNDPSDWTTASGGGDAFITGQKLIACLPARGGSAASPSGILWSLDSVIRAYYTGATTKWTFDTVSAQSSIISSQCAIEYDGIFYWVGVDRFLMYNGVVKEVPNTMNLNFFFDNINWAYRQKVFAIKVPRWGEIWWCFPYGDATECNWAVVYNVRENTWYDTPLPNTGRSSGIYAAVYHHPLMTGVGQNGAYTLWQHEFGVDEINGQQISPIPSFFETGDISMTTSQDPKNRSMRVSMIEPDFVQVGDMDVQITGRANARAPEVISEARTFPAQASNPQQQVTFHKDIRREMRFRFTSNTLGGDYQMGQPLAHVEPADGTVLG